MEIKQNREPGTKTGRKMGCQKVASRGLLQKTEERLFCSAQKVGPTKWSSFFTQVAYKMFIASQTIDFYKLQAHIWV